MREIVRRRQVSPRPVHPCVRGMLRARAPLRLQHKATHLTRCACSIKQLTSGGGEGRATRTCTWRSPRCTGGRASAPRRSPSGSSPATRSARGAAPGPAQLRTCSFPQPTRILDRAQAARRVPPPLPTTVAPTRVPTVYSLPPSLQGQYHPRCCAPGRPWLRRAVLAAALATRCFPSVFRCPLRGYYRCLQIYQEKLMKRGTSQVQELQGHGVGHNSAAVAAGARQAARELPRQGLDCPSHCSSL